MGLCYSLRPRLFGDLSGTISSANSEPEQPPDLLIPSRGVGESRRDESGGNKPSPAPLQTHTYQWDAAGKTPLGERRLGGDATADGALIQNGGGNKAPATVKDRSRRLHLLPTSSHKAKNLDRPVEEKEAEKEARKVSKNIDRVLKELKREYKQTHRLLLLGKITGWNRTHTQLSPPLSAPHPPLSLSLSSHLLHTISFISKPH